MTKGDKVYTKSGILGTINTISARVVTLEISKGVKLKILKEQIGGMAKNLFEETIPNKDKTYSGPTLVHQGKKEG